VLHLCDHTKCVLPPPDWYLKRKAEGEAKQTKELQGKVGGDTADRK